MIGTKQIFYLVLWSMLAHSAYLIGLLLQHTGKVTNGCVLGKTMIVIIVFLLLGLAHGFDTFMFI